MTNIFQVQINIALCVLLICLFSYAFYKMNRKTLTNKLFMWIIGLTNITLILEGLSVLLNVPGMKNWIIINKLVNMFGFIITPIIPFIGYLFCREWIRRYENHKYQSSDNITDNSENPKYAIKIKYIFFLPLILETILAVISCYGGQLFFISENNEYLRGPLFLMLPCLSFFYFIISLYYIFSNFRKYTFSERILFSMMFIIPAFFTIIQIKNPTYLTIWSSTAIIVVITFIIILNDQIYRDSLTGLENRWAYEQYIQKINDKNFKKIHMIYMDIDNFKAINDRFGHNEGDEALKIFAKFIIENFQLRHKKILRIGGDEFLIIIEEDQLEKISECLKNLIEKTDEYNNKKTKAYRIEFSYGIEKYSDAFESMNQLMDYVDHMMYKHKQSKKKIKED